MDNLKAPIHARTRIESVGAYVLFLPPYSFELNPQAWAKLKDIIRRLPNKTRELFDIAVAKAMDQISQERIRQWTAFSGYSTVFASV